MDNNVVPSPERKRTGYVMAVVVGTALIALGLPPDLAAARPDVQEETLRDLSRYCTTCWRNARLAPDSWSDYTQDVFYRLLERIAPRAWDRVLKDDECEERREFLRAIDAVKKRAQRGRGRYVSLLGPVTDRRDLHDRFRADQRTAVADAAVDLLSPRQQCIVQKSFEGWSVQEIAKEMAVPAERVSDEKYKAIRKLRGHFQGRADV